MKGVSLWVYTTEKNLNVIKGKLLDEKKTLKFGNAMPLDLSPFPMTREELGVAADAFVFTLVARGIKSKGWESAIVAFSKLRDENPHFRLQLLLCGEGEETERVKGVYRNSLGITFLGYQRNIVGLFRISDCAILPTRFVGESFPLCLIQAMQAGLPIIATRIGEIENMICRGGERAGILMEPFEDEDMFNLEVFISMSKMLDHKLRAEFAKNSATFGELYDMDELTTRYYKLYESLIDNHRCSAP